MSRIYTYTRDKVDSNDIKFLVPSSDDSKVVLPKSVDLREQCPPVYEQGELGSCTANAGCAYRAMMHKNKDINFSRLFLYYVERSVEGTVTKDSGASLRDTCRVLQKIGVCEEKYMAYNVDKFAKSPSKKAFINAINYKITGYKSLSSLDDIKQNLALNQRPVLIGMNVYESMESETVSKTGVLPMPKKNETLLGGHAVLVVGYKDIKKSYGTLFKRTVRTGYLIVRNSWGSDWGDKGYFYMPYEYIKPEYTYDYWIME